MSSKDRSWRDPLSADFAVWLSGGWCSCISKFIARPCAVPLLEFLAVSSSVCGLSNLWPPPSTGSEALASGELVLVEEFLLDNSVARELGVEEGVVVGGLVEVVVFSRDSAHRKNTNLMNTVSLCQLLSAFNSCISAGPLYIQSIPQNTFDVIILVQSERQIQSQTNFRVNLEKNARRKLYMKVGFLKNCFRSTALW